MKKKSYLFLLLLFSIKLFAQEPIIDVDTIRVGRKFENFVMLKESTHQYLRFLQKDDKRQIMDLWTRKISFKEKDGNNYILIDQTWQGSDTTKNKKLQSISRSFTFEPVEHTRYTSGKGMEAYAFSVEKIEGLAGVANNLEKEFVLELDKPTFNFEIDFEILSSLPLRENYKAVINFYHPGGSNPPAYYDFKVIGSENLSVANGNIISTWVLFCDYHGNFPTKFWISKNTQEVIKQVSEFQGMELYKVLLY